MNSTSRANVVSSSPPCTQPHLRKASPDEANEANDDGSQEEDDPEPINMSDSDDNMVEVIKDDEAELGECGCVAQY
jgi:hypothetical protein